MSHHETRGRATIGVTAALLVLVVILGEARYPAFSWAPVAANLLVDKSFLLLAAVGLTYVILAGGIDLSVGSVLACTSILLAALITRHGVHPLWAVAIGATMGALFGAAQGALIQFFELPAFLVTLAGMFLARGLGFVIEPQSMAIKHGFYADLNALSLHLGTDVSLAVPGWFFLAAVAAALVVLRFTRLGRWVYAVGDDAAAARINGVPVGRTRVAVYALCGLHASLAGAVYTLYTQAGDPAAAVGFELDAIAAVVIGGTLLRGGSGSVVGTALGVLVLGLIQTVLEFEGNLSSWWTRIAIGALMLVFLVPQGLARRRHED